ncbi:MAG: helix-turn-helix domain-containing protein [Armatimonadota bacterium]
MDVRQLGNRLKDQRDKRKLRQADIAGALGVSTQAVSKWERGENAPDISLLVELGRLLGVSVEWILGGTSAETDTFPAAVFCTSLNGFAERASSMSPRELAAWANGIYYTVTQALLEAEGVPIKYVGDGFLGFLTGTDCCRRALDAAENARRRLNTPDFVTVINYGDVYLGSIGHPDYARPDILGETVNTAFLVMPWVAANAKTGIGLTESVRDNLPEIVAVARCGEVAVPGREVPVVIYERCQVSGAGCQ